MLAKGSDLIFISQIKRDGSGVVIATDIKHLKKERYRLSCLSMTEKTWIASGFNSYVVKLKDEKGLIKKNTTILPEYQW